MHPYLFLSLFPIVFLQQYVTGSILNRNKMSINDHFNELANHVASKYFSNHKCIVVVSETGLLNNLKINTTLVHIDINSTKESCVEDVADILRNTFQDNCDGYIIQLSNPKCAFQGWLEIYYHASIGRHNPKYFFLPVYPSLKTYADELLSMRESDLTTNFLVSEIYENSTAIARVRVLAAKCNFAYAELLNMSTIMGGDSLVALVCSRDIHQNWSVIISTNNFYLHPTIPGREPKLYLDEWHYKNGFKENADLYPNKVLDLQGKAFRISAGKYLPLSSPDPLDGAEIRIALYFCELYNCTPQPVFDSALWGSIYDNLSADGVLGNCYNDRADIGIMAIYLFYKEWQYIEYTSSYLSGYVTLMIPKPTKLSAWILPFLPFKIDMWIAFLVSLVLSAFSLYFVTTASIKFTRFREILMRKVQFTTIQDSSLRAIGLAVLQQPSSRLIGDSPNRYLFTSFEFLYLILSAMYSAELSSFLTVPLYHPPIDTFHDLAQSGILWFGTDLAWVALIQGSDEEDAQIIVDSFDVLTMDQLKEKIKEGKYGFTVEILPGGSFSEQDFQTADVIPLYHIMKEKLFGSPLVTSIKKGSPYLKYYNKVVTKVLEHGHFLYWEGDAARKYLNSRTQSAFREIRTVHFDRTPAVIQISNIQGIIFLYIFGITNSIIVFFIEIIRHSKLVIPLTQRIMH